MTLDWRKFAEWDAQRFSTSGLTWTQSILTWKRCRRQESNNIKKIPEEHRLSKRHDVDTMYKNMDSATYSLGEACRAHELCESRGGCPGLPVPNGPCGRKATLKMNWSL